MERITLQAIRKSLANVFDVQERELECSLGTVHLFYILSMCDSRQISDFVIRPLLQQQPSTTDEPETVIKSILQTGTAKLQGDLDGAVHSILSGCVVILLPHQDKAISCNLKGYEKRPVEIPMTETVIKGPREGFTEDICTNISSIRRRIKTPSLKMERFYLGSETRTETILFYLEGCTPQKLIDYVRSKIQQIEADKTKYVFYTNQLEDLLKCKHTPFDTIGYTEKPDVAAAKLSEGRVLVMVDGNPFVITAPMFFIENFQTTDDYTLNPMMANMGRTFRWLAFITSTFIPGLYLALVTYHFKLVPNIFLYRLVIFRASVPVPTVVELLYMTLVFQIIREAGVRLPQPIGPTLSIVGALILGEAAVTSGLASQITVVIVAITSIASYLIPVFHAPIFLFSVMSILFAAMLGLPGYAMSFVMFVAHLAGLTSCGYPFLYPFGTEKSFQYSDVFVRGKMKKDKTPPLAEEDKP